MSPANEAAKRTAELTHVVTAADDISGPAWFVGRRTRPTPFGYDGDGPYREIFDVESAEVHLVPDGPSTDSRTLGGWQAADKPGGACRRRA
jgi:hypothetical protein